MPQSLPPEITEIELAEDYPALEVKTHQCTAILALHGAHLTHWQPAHTAQPVIYTSPTAVYREGKAVRGGVPICWPWFNAHPTMPETHPSHGVARNRSWQLESATVIEGVARVTLLLTADPTMANFVPFEFQLKATFTLGATCSIELETTNLSLTSVPVGGALHTYLALSHIDAVHLVGLRGTRYLDTTVVPEVDVLQAGEELRITSEVDRIYYGTAQTVTIHDAQWNRRVEVSKTGSETTVVWNPWLAKATALGDMPDDGYQDFVCIEAANARQDTRLLAPNEAHVLATHIKVSS